MLYWVNTALFRSNGSAFVALESYLNTFQLQCLRDSPSRAAQRTGREFAREWRGRHNGGSFHRRGNLRRREAITAVVFVFVFVAEVSSQTFVSPR